MNVGQGVAVAALLALAAVAAFALASGASLLEATLPGGLPFGNALAALALLAIAGAATVLSRPRSACRCFAGLSLAGAALWLPASVVLAGNLQLNLGGTRGTVWLVFSLVVCAGAWTGLLWATAARVLERVRRIRRA